jgi:hypothetical protein
VKRSASCGLKELKGRVKECSEVRCFEKMNRERKCEHEETEWKGAIIMTNWFDTLGFDMTIYIYIYIYIN